MITKPTVLVLGAGASMPYGFPSGEELLQTIHSNTDLTYPPFPEAHPKNWYNMLNQCGISKSKIINFRNDLYQSHQPSVDAFLEYRPEYLDVGKLCIALALIPFEDEKLLDSFNVRNTGFYDYLLQKMNTPFENFCNNNQHGKNIR